MRIGLLVSEILRYRQRHMQTEILLLLYKMKSTHQAVCLSVCLSIYIITLEAMLTDASHSRFTNIIISLTLASLGTILSEISFGTKVFTSKIIWQCYPFFIVILPSKHLQGKQNSPMMINISKPSVI